MLLKRGAEISGCAWLLYDVRSWSLASTNRQAPTPQHVPVNADLKVCLHPALREIKYLHIGAISGIMIVNAIDR
jgi:hypothetical protein